MRGKPNANDRQGALLTPFHFVRDYERLVDQLVRNYPIDEAMSMAVGGRFESIGAIERDVLNYLGLKDGMSLMDLGCGSGRLASALSKRYKLDYTGADIVQALLDYAKTKSDPAYAFLLHRDLSIPLPDGSQDFFTAFSVFTHLLHNESYIYLEEAKRILKPNGLAVFSFLEFAAPTHWATFTHTTAATRMRSCPHLNTFIERSAIAVWAEHLDFTVVEFIDPDKAPWGGIPLGQSIAVLRT